MFLSSFAHVPCIYLSYLSRWLLRSLTHRFLYCSRSTRVAELSTVLRSIAALRGMSRTITPVLLFLTQLLLGHILLLLKEVFSNNTLK